MILKHLARATALCAILAIPYNPMYAAQKSVVNSASNTYFHFLTKNILPARLLENNTLRRTAYFILGTVAVITAKKIANSFTTRITDARLKTLVDEYNTWKNKSANKCAALKDLLQEWNRTVPHLKFYHYWGMPEHSTKGILVSKERFVQDVVWTIFKYAGEKSTELDEVRNLFGELLTHFDKDTINKTISAYELAPNVFKISDNRNIAIRSLVEKLQLNIDYKSYTVHLIAGGYSLQEVKYALSRAPESLKSTHLFEAALKQAVDKDNSLYLNFLHDKLKETNSELDQNIFFDVMKYQDEFRSKATILLVKKYHYDLNKQNDKGMTFLDQFVIARNRKYSYVLFDSASGLGSLTIKQTTLDYFKLLVDLRARFGNIKAVKNALPGIIEYNTKHDNLDMANDFVNVFVKRELDKHANQ
ncbi:hypothetical protein J120_02400 [candidate division TM6 bacterium JCVI TM6SC1]|uniref:Uncharacterized protein n=1 Tax=candidate division TM6 bacterium JCVI TM6SC1 TaxID=1306947 RepID=A0A0D2GP75_9BACT|nr:hypothetical protein J120_02400 [candidate division TM6 bacterium JCVI TM6SC1]